MAGVRNILMRGLHRFGVAKLLLGRNRRAREVPVLLFHRISPDPDPFWPPLDPEVFRNILRFFSRYYSFRPLEDLLDEEEIPTNAAFISFDDAFADFEEHALPILQELELPATLFVPTGSIDAGESIWPSLVDRYIEEKRNIGEEWIELVGERLDTRFLNEEELEGAAGAFKQRLMGLSYEDQMEIREQLEGRGFSEQSPPMSWDSLKRLPDLITLGAHTEYHPYLPSVADEGMIEREMQRSKERLQKMTGRSVRSFAYPFGGHDERSERIAGRYFELAFTTEGGRVSLDRFQDPAFRTRIPRIDVHDKDSKEALLRVNGLHNWVKGKGL